MHLDFELCDRNQHVLTRLDNRRPGGRVEVGLNAARRAFCPLSLEDPAYALAEATKTLLRITLRGAADFSLPLFIGRVVIPEQGRSEGEEQLGIHAIDPLFQLQSALVRDEDGPVWNPVTFAGIDQSQIMWSLVHSAESHGHGVSEGVLPASIARDRTYVPGKEIGAALLEMSEVIGGPDFEIQPILDPDGAGDGALGSFHTHYPRQGSDLSESIVFVCGASPSTASGFVFAPGGDEIVNRVLAIGAPLNNEGEGEEPQPYATFPGYVAEHADSIAEHDVWERVVQLEDVVEGATLKAHAEGIVASGASPVPYFDFIATPEQAGDEVGDGVPPVFGRDYWIGDTIGVDFWAPGADEPLKVTGRITDATVTELESGQIQVKHTCAPEVKSTGITGEAVTLKVPEVVE